MLSFMDQVVEESKEDACVSRDVPRAYPLHYPARVKVRVAAGAGKPNKDVIWDVVCFRGPGLGRWCMWSHDRSRYEDVAGFSDPRTGEPIHVGRVLGMAEVKSNQSPPYAGVRAVLVSALARPGDPLAVPVLDLMPAEGASRTSIALLPDACPEHNP